MIWSHALHETGRSNRLSRRCRSKAGQGGALRGRVYLTLVLTRSCRGGSAAMTQCGHAVSAATVRAAAKTAPRLSRFATTGTRMRQALPGHHETSAQPANFRLLERAARRAGGARARRHRARRDRAAFSATALCSPALPARSQFRVAGTRLCALFGRELRGQAFSTIWEPESAAELRGQSSASSWSEIIGIAAGARTECRRRTVVQCRDAASCRSHIGAGLVRACSARLLSLERPYWLGIWPAEPLRLSHRPVCFRTGCSRAAPDPRRRWQRLTVIDGGKS